MDRIPGAAGALLACLAVTAALAGCGSGARTVTVVEAPSAGSTGTATASTQTTSSAPATTPATTTGSSAGGTSAPTTTRAAPEPAFTEGETHAEGATAAAAVVRAHGYTPADLSEYHQGQTLRVLVGTRTGSADGHGQLAFFFVNGRYIGTDAKLPSANVKVLSQGEAETILAYPLYHSADALCCPSGGQARVRFALDNGSLHALDPIPPAYSASAPTRR